MYNTFITNEIFVIHFSLLISTTHKYLQLFREMKFITGFYFFLLYFKNNIEAVKIEYLDSLTTTQKTPSQVNYFENLSIQDILDSGIDENDKIEKKILQAITEFTSDINAHSPIKLMGESLSPRKSIKIDLDSGYKAALENLTIVHSNGGPHKRRYATDVDCNLFGNITISIVLPYDLRIAALVKVNHKSKKSLIEGEIDVTLKGTKLYKTLGIANPLDGSNSGEDNSEIEYENAEMHIKVEKEVKNLIYSKMDIIMHELENSVKETFEQELNKQISTNNTSIKNHSLVLFCSKKITTEQSKKKVSLPLQNNFNFNIRPLYYVIAEKTTKPWRGAILSAGPIILDGLSHFQNLELKVSENEHESNRDEIMKDLTANLKTGELKGKFEWGYFMTENNRNRSSVGSFSVDFLQLENAVAYATSRLCYQNLLKVHLGEIKINESNDLCENENLFLNSFLSEYLSIIMKMYLENTITSKINLNPFFSSCPGVSQWRR